MTFIDWFMIIGTAVILGVDYYAYRKGGTPATISGISRVHPFIAMLWGALFYHLAFG